MIRHQQVYLSSRFLILYLKSYLMVKLLEGKGMSKKRRASLAYRNFPLLSDLCQGWSWWDEQKEGELFNLISQPQSAVVKFLFQTPPSLLHCLFSTAVQLLDLVISIHSHWLTCSFFPRVVLTDVCQLLVSEFVAPGLDVPGSDQHLFRRFLCQPVLLRGWCLSNLADCLCQESLKQSFLYWMG